MMIYQVYDHGGKYLGGTPLREQAVGAARKEAARSGRDADVVQVRIDDGRLRRVRYHPDGTAERLWAKDISSVTAGAVPRSPATPGEGRNDTSSVTADAVPPSPQGEGLGEGELSG